MWPISLPAFFDTANGTNKSNGWLASPLHGHGNYRHFLMNDKKVGMQSNPFCRALINFSTDLWVHTHKFIWYIVKSSPPMNFNEHGTMY